MRYHAKKNDVPDPIPFMFPISRCEVISLTNYFLNLHR